MRLAPGPAVAVPPPPPVATAAATGTAAAVATPAAITTVNFPYYGRYELSSLLGSESNTVVAVGVAFDCCSS